jgi:hypothetical protein
MKVLSAGCSFIWGNELSDDAPGKFSLNTWPALWAKENNHEYDCCASPGAANSTIVRKVIDYVENNKPNIVIVQWTLPGRQEFRYQQNFNSEWGNFYAFTPWSTVKSWEEIYNDPKKYPFNRDAENSKAFEESIKRQIEILKDTCVPDLARIWFKHITCTDSDRYYFFKEVSYLKYYLESNNIKYVFSGADSNLCRDKTPTSDKTVATLMKISDSCPWVWFDYHNVPFGFLDWARASRQEIGSTHPLDSAHKNALNIVRNKLNDILS